MSLSKEKASEQYVPLDLEEGEHPTLKQRLKTVAALAGVYYIVTHQVLKPLAFHFFSKFSQWKVLAGRAGTFNKSAQDEIVYIGLAGIHHCICAGLIYLAKVLKEKGQHPTESLTNRSLYLYAGLGEYAFEWTDFVLMATKKWPYQDRDPKFTALLIFHHLWGLLNFPATASDVAHKVKVQSLVTKLLGVAGIGCLVYPVQQLLNLETRSGLKKALALNAFNMACHCYVRFYLYFTEGREMFEMIETYLKENKKENFVKYSWGGYYSLTVFNVLVLLGGLQKASQYITALRSLK